jgi:hypothetical protein
MHRRVRSGGNSLESEVPPEDTVPMEEDEEEDVMAFRS